MLGDDVSQLYRLSAKRFGTTMARWRSMEVSNYSSICWTAPCFVVVHMALSVALAVGGVLLYRRGERRPFIFISIISIVAFGPFGLAGIGLAACLRRPFARSATPSEEWYASLFPQYTPDRIQVVHDLIMTRRAGIPRRSSVAAFDDILELGTVDQKQVMLALVADHFNPAYARTLKSALNDPEPAIRVLAATAVARLEDQFATRLSRLSRSLESEPDNPGLLLAQAEKMREYAESGLLSPARAEEAWQGALSLVERRAARDEDDWRPAEVAAKALLRLGRADKAVAALDPWTDRSELSAGAFAVYLEALFSLGKYEQLRQACSRIRHMAEAGATQPEKSELAILWSSPGGSDAQGLG